MIGGSSSSGSLQVLVYSAAATLAIVGAGFLAWREYLDNERKQQQQQQQQSTSRRGVGSPLPAMSLSRYQGCVYLDYNATTPIFPEVTSTMLPFSSSCFGNPSSPHVFGAPCREAVKAARIRVAELINVGEEDAEECVIFTSCGTESDNVAINIALHNFSLRQASAPHIITCAIEHPAILGYLQVLVARKAITLTILPVSSEGFVNPAAVAAALTPSTALVTIMHSNNEVGTIQPMREIAKVVHSFNSATSSGVLLHTDAAQSVGKVTLDVQSQGVDMLTLVGHKFGAPKGVAALFVKKGLQIEPMFVGGGQERGRRAGTENVMLIVALGEASRIARVEAAALLLHLLTLKKRLILELRRGLGDVEDFLRLNGPKRSVEPVEIEGDLSLLRIILASSDAPLLNSTSLLLEQLPNTLSVSFRNIRVAELMPLLVSTVACSAGSACHSDSTHISPVLGAMGVPREYALGTLRLSLGRHSTEQEVDLAASHIIRAVKSLQR